jgi:hypothetical protein
MNLSEIKQAVREGKTVHWGRTTATAAIRFLALRKKSVKPTNAIQ